MTGSRWQTWTVDFALVGALLLSPLLLLGPSASNSWAQGKSRKGGQGKAKSGGASEATDVEMETVEQVDIGTRDVLDRLKLLRVQMALDREEITALELRIEKIKKEREFETVLNAGTAVASARPRAENPLNSIIVKQVTLSPRKEAVIMYRGRMLTIRPGEKIGGIEIRDITESGLEVKSGKAGTSTVR